MQVNFSCSHFTEWYYLSGDVLPLTRAVIIVSGICIIPSTVLNTVLLVAIVRTNSLHTPQNIFMCNLAISNLGFSCLGTPLFITWKVMERHHHDDDVLCFFMFLSYIVCSIFCGVSFLTITAASVDRYLALRLHLSYVAMVTNLKTIIACVVLWVMSTTLALLVLIGRNEYSIATAIGMFLIIVVMVYCYLKIFHILRRHHNQIQSQTISQTRLSIANISRYRKSLLSLIYVLAIYIAFYAPYSCSLVILAQQGVSVLSLRVWSVGVLLPFINAFVNPLFHCLKFDDIRNATREIVCQFLTRTRQTA